MIAHYAHQGYPLSELMELNALEREFLFVAWELEIERETKKWGG